MQVFEINEVYVSLYSIVISYENIFFWFFSQIENAEMDLYRYNINNSYIS